MKILWLTWKDINHPRAGGAEVVCDELAKRLVADGHEVTILTARFKGAPSKESIHGYSVMRVGGRWSVYWHAYRYYAKYLKGWADVVIDEVNTVPFFAKLYVKEKNVVLIHQLTNSIWFYEMSFPLNLIGYLLEPLMLRLLNDREVITVSESTKRDLLRHGFKESKIHIISEGTNIPPAQDIEHIEKYPKPTMLSFGSLRPMKRTSDIVTAFEIAKKKLPELQLIVAGTAVNGYGKRVLAQIQNSPYADSITYLGPVDQATKIEIMQKSHVLAVTSVKEGWCLVVTEANSQGTPAVVYDVDGLRDSVRDGQTGVVCKTNTPASLGHAIASLLSQPDKYTTYRNNAWEWSKTITFEKSYEDFKKIFYGNR
jgi:glycosyltransferase involved in cell wall biosynthesis